MSVLPETCSWRKKVSGEKKSANESATAARRSQLVDLTAEEKDNPTITVDISWVVVVRAVGGKRDVVEFRSDGVENCLREQRRGWAIESIDRQNRAATYRRDLRLGLDEILTEVHAGRIRNFQVYDVAHRWNRGD